MSDKSLVDEVYGGTSSSNRALVDEVYSSPKLDTPEAIKSHIRDTAAKNGIDPALATGLFEHESNFNPKATNPKTKAAGIAQLMPETQKRYGVKDPYNAAANIDAGIRHFKNILAEHKGDVDKALSAYGGFKTKDPSRYIASVKANALKYQEQPKTVGPLSRAVTNIPALQLQPGISTLKPESLVDTTRKLRNLEGSVPEMEQAKGLSIGMPHIQPKFRLGATEEAPTTPESRARADVITSIAKDYNLPIEFVDKNLDAITKEMGIRGIPTSREMVGTGMKMLIASGFAMNPVTTVTGILAYSGLSEAENLAVAKLKGDKYKFGEGKEVKDFLGNLQEPYNTLADIAEFSAKAGIVGAGFDAIKGSTWFRMLTNKERALVVPVIDEMKTEGKPIGDIIRDKWKNGSKGEREALLKKYQGVKTEAERTEEAIKQGTKETPYTEDLKKAEEARANRKVVPDEVPATVEKGKPEFPVAAFKVGDEIIKGKGDQSHDALADENYLEESDRAEANRGYFYQGAWHSREDTNAYLKANFPDVYKELNEISDEKPHTTELNKAVEKVEETKKPEPESAKPSEELHRGEVDKQELTFKNVDNLVPIARELLKKQEGKATNGEAATALGHNWKDLNKDERMIVGDVLEAATIPEGIMGEQAPFTPETKVSPEAKSEPAYDKEHLQFIRERIATAEGPSKTKDIETGEVTSRLKSGYPEWFQNKGYTQKDTLNILDKAIEGKKLTDIQKNRLQDLADMFGAKTGLEGKLPAKEQTADTPLEIAAQEARTQEAQKGQGELLTKTKGEQDALLKSREKDNLLGTGAPIKRYPKEGESESEHKQMQSQRTGGLSISEIAQAISAEAGRDVGTKDFVLHFGKAADDLNRIAGTFGKKVVIFQAAEGQHISNTAAFYHQALPDHIFLQEGKATAPHLALIGHELVHSLKNDYPDLYDKLSTEIKSALKKYELDNYIRGQIGESPTEAQIDHYTEEYIGNYVRDRFVSRGFWHDMMKKAPEVFKQIITIVRNMLAKIEQAFKGQPENKIFRDIKKARNVVSDTMAEYAIRQNKPVNEVFPEAEETGESGAIRLSLITPNVEAVKDSVQSLWKAYSSPPEHTESKHIIGQYTGALQIIDHDLAKYAKEINKYIPRNRQTAITNYMQAGGDMELLNERAKTANPEYRSGYKDAVNLTQEEKDYASTFRKRYDDIWQQAHEAGILDDYVENYVRGEWERPEKAGRKIMAQVNAGLLRTKPREALRKVFQDYFEGEKAGFKPKDKRIGYQLIAAERSIRQAIEARKALKNLMHSTEKDGRPTVIVGGAGVPVDKSEGETGKEAYYIKPNAKEHDTADYRYLPHPALRKWKWVGQDVEGKPILMQGNMWIHPDAYPRLNALLGRSAIRDYTIPEKIPIIGGTQPGRAALQAGAFIKGSILIGPFHQFHISEHAIFHKVSPFRLPEIDFEKRPILKELVEHGLMLYNHNALSEFSEGLTGGGLWHKIPGIGHVLRQYQEYLFQGDIPKLKAAMAEAAWHRAEKWYGQEMKNYAEYADLKDKLDRTTRKPDDKTRIEWEKRFNELKGKKRVSRDQILDNIGNQGNAAFGEQNYKYIGRNPTLQDALRIGLLAPDFLESRLKFGGQALRPYGREQLHALIRGAIIMGVTAQVINMLVGDEHKPHFSRPFSVIIGGREYNPRSVVGDYTHLLTDPRGFWYYRLNPLWGRPFIEGLTGRDRYGKKVAIQETAKDVLKSWVPIPGQGFIKNNTGNTLVDSVINSLLQSVGVSNYPFQSDFERYFHNLDRPAYPSTDKSKLKTEIVNKMKKDKDAGEKAIDEAEGLTNRDISDIRERATNPTGHMAKQMTLKELAKAAAEVDFSKEEKAAIYPVFSKKISKAWSTLSDEDQARYTKLLEGLRTGDEEEESGNEGEAVNE